MLNELRGCVLMLVAVSLWGFGGVIVKILTTEAADPIVVLQVRMMLALGLIFLILLLFQRDALKIKLKDIPYLIIYGVFGLSLLPYSYYLTIHLTNVGTAVFLNYLAPILVALFSAVFLREQMTRLKVVSILFAIIGTFLIITGGKAGLHINPLGLATGLISAALLAFHTLWSKKGTSRFNPWTILFYGNIVAAIFLLFLNPPWVLAKNSFSGETWGLLAFLAFFVAVLPYWLYLLGLKFLTPTKAIIASTFETVAASLFAYFLLQETMTPLQIFGSSLILAAIIAVQLRRDDDPDHTDDLNHTKKESGLDSHLNANQP